VNFLRLADIHIRLPHEAAPPDGLSPGDSLFAMLDGQIIRGRTGAWRAEVVSILSQAEETWIQIGPAMHPAMAVVMRMRQDQNADVALDALRRWTDLPEEQRPHRIDVVSNS
jgi:hypothetical protein